MLQFRFSRVLTLLLVTLTVFLVACSPSETTTPSPTVDTNAQSTSDVEATDEVSATSEPYRILRLDSYHPEYAWTFDINRGLLEALADAGWQEGEDYVIDYFYMDTKRNTTPEYFETIAEEAIAYIENNAPDIVIGSDNNAVRLVMQPLLETGIPMIFAGLNDEPETYGMATADNVTGVLERVYIDETFSWIQNVFGEDARITALFDESVTSEVYADDLRQIAEEIGITNLTIHRTNEYETWQSLVSTEADTSDVYLVGTYHTIRENDESINEDEVMAWTVQNSEIPIVPFWEFSMPLGVLGGSVISGYTQGFETGIMAQQILTGTSPADIPIITPQRGKLIINMSAIERWSVDIPLELLELSEIVE
jgi:ABC-type uncharacterized transport system substrate-binding protein